MKEDFTEDDLTDIEYLINHHIEYLQSFKRSVKMDSHVEHIIEEKQRRFYALLEKVRSK